MGYVSLARSHRSCSVCGSAATNFTQYSGQAGIPRAETALNTGRSFGQCLEPDIDQMLSRLPYSGRILNFRIMLNMKELKGLKAGNTALYVVSGQWRNIESHAVRGHGIVAMPCPCEDTVPMFESSIALLIITSALL